MKRGGRFGELGPATSVFKFTPACRATKGFKLVYSRQEGTREEGGLGESMLKGYRKSRSGFTTSLGKTSKLVELRVHRTRTN